MAERAQRKGWRNLGMAGGWLRCRRKGAKAWVLMQERRKERGERDKRFGFWNFFGC